MKLSTYNPNNADEIEQLFIKTFSDSEGQSEGEVIEMGSSLLLTHFEENVIY